MRRPGVPLISALSALSLCRSRTAVKGISLRAIATALTKTREELERQGLAAIWFEVVNSHKQNGLGATWGAPSVAVEQRRRWHALAALPIASTHYRK